MPQYKVPQFIDIEDKIVGPFTMKQFIYLLVGGAIDYGLFSYFNQFENGLPYFIVLALPVTLLALALTFIKINDRPFEIFLLNLVFYVFLPKKRFWQRGAKSQPALIATTPPKKTPKAGPQKNLEDLAKELDIKAPPPPEKGKGETFLGKISARVDSLAAKSAKAPPQTTQPSTSPPAPKPGLSKRILTPKP